MSVVRQFSMRCDECGDGEDDFYGSYSEDVRREAKEAGWIRRGNRDLCADCASPKCDHSGDWDHHYDPDSRLGDYYTCSDCGDLTQVG